MRVVICAAAWWVAAGLRAPPSYVVVYRGAHGGFRLNEWEAARAGVSEATLRPADASMALEAAAHCGGDVGPPLFMVTEGAGSAEEMARVAARSVLTRAVLELWGGGASVEAAVQDARRAGVAALDEARSWRVCQMKVGAAKGKTGGAALRTCSDARVLGALAPVLEAACPGRVDLGECADETVVVAYDFDRAVDDHGGRGEPDPRRVYVGRLVARGDRETRLKFRLQDRPVIGTTTMDPETAALMARLARLEVGDVAVDPFAGTCGCLLACSHLTRASGVAADVDGTVLLDAMANFDAYDLPRPAAHVCEVRRLPPLIDGRGRVDAIVTDPPYGKRESIAGGDVEWLHDLLALADATLNVGGRLVFFVPHAATTESAAVAARVAALAPAYAVEAAPSQRLSGPWRRTLLVLRRDGAATSAAAETDDDEAPLHADLAGYWRAGGARSRSDAAEKRAAKIARRRRRAGAERRL